MTLATPFSALLESQNRLLLSPHLPISMRQLFIARCQDLLLPRVIRSPVITADLPVLDHKHMDTAAAYLQRGATGVLVDKHDIWSQGAHGLHCPLKAGKLLPLRKCCFNDVF